MEKNPLGAATAIGYSSQGQIQVERNWNVVWGKVQALASRPGLVSLRSCTQGCVCSVGAAPPWCLSHKTWLRTCHWDILLTKTPRIHPLNLSSSSYQLLSYNGLGKQNPYSALGMCLVEPVLGDVIFIPWQQCEHCLANPLGLSSQTLDKVKENDQRHAAKCKAGHLISKLEWQRAKAHDSQLAFVANFCLGTDGKAQTAAHPRARMLGSVLELKHRPWLVTQVKVWGHPQQVCRWHQMSGAVTHLGQLREIMMCWRSGPWEAHVV